MNKKMGLEKVACPLFSPSHAFLKRKMDEYEMLKMEIEELKREVGPDQSLPD